MEADLHVPMLPAGTAALVRRLRRAAGQVAGVERMLADGRSCEEMLIQLAAVHGALRAVEQQLLGCHVTATTASVAAGELSPAEAAEQTAFLAGLLAHTSAARSAGRNRPRGERRSHVDGGSCGVADTG